MGFEEKFYGQSSVFYGQNKNYGLEEIDDIAFAVAVAVVVVADLYAQDSHVAH